MPLIGPAQLPDIIRGARTASTKNDQSVFRDEGPGHTASSRGRIRDLEPGPLPTPKIVTPGLVGVACRGASAKDDERPAAVDETGSEEPARWRSVCRSLSPRVGGEIKDLQIVVTGLHVTLPPEDDHPACCRIERRGEKTAFDRSGFRRKILPGLGLKIKSLDILETPLIAEAAERHKPIANRIKDRGGAVSTRRRRNRAHVLPFVGIQIQRPYVVQPARCRKAGGCTAALSHQS